MSALFEELDWSPTPIGPVSLRRRRDLHTGADVFEVKLGDEFLMSSLFTASEVALARLGLAAVEGERLDVVVGGLGLGHTAAAALDDPRVASLTIVEFLEPVIDWHARGLVPLGPRLAGDPRCRIVQGDFFAMAAGSGFDPREPDRRFDAILLDIDHTPDDLLDDARSRDFYTHEGLGRVRTRLVPGGVFGLWSNLGPDEAFRARLGAVFEEARAEPVRFHNPLQDAPALQSVYVGVRRS
ncbi:MAG: spermidine synthase [Salinarimonas sp.]